MKWNFETVGTKDHCRKFLDEQQYVARKLEATAVQKGQVVETAPGKPVTDARMTATEVNARRDHGLVSSHASVSNSPIRSLERHGVDVHATDPGKLDMSRVDTTGRELERHDTPKLVVDVLKQMVDGILFEPPHPDPKLTYAVSLKSDGQGDDVFFAGRFEVSRIAVGK